MISNDKQQDKVNNHKQKEHLTCEWFQQQDSRL